MAGRAGILAAGALALALLSSPRAQAEEPPPPVFRDEARVREAEALARQAEALAAEGKADEALEVYRAAWVKHRDPRVAARLGELELGRGATVEAATHLAFAARAWPPGERAEGLAAAQARLAEAKQQVGELRVRAGAPLAEVWVDGARVGYAMDASFFVAPGRRAVEIRGAGYRPERREIEIAAGEAKDVAVTLTRSGPPRASAEEPERAPAPPPPRKSVPLIAGGLSSAAMLGLLGAGLATQGGEEQQVIGVIMLVGGGALAIGTGVYAVWPQASADRAGVTVAGTF